MQKVPNLKNSIISEILKNLNNDEFCREDFTISFPDESSTLAVIEFSSMPKYFFRIEEGYSGLNRFTTALTSLQQQESKKTIYTIESPGDYKNDERHDHISIQSAVDRVVDWTANIREDLLHARDTVRATIDQATADFQSKIDENVDNPEDYFNDDEKAELLDRLNELQSRVESLEAELGLEPKEVAVIEQAIEKSKANIEFYPKGVWYKTAGTKLMKLLKETLKTKEGRQIVTDIIKKLIGSE